MWGVPSPPVGRSSVVDRRIDQIQATLDSIKSEIAVLESALADQSERELRAIRNLYSSPESLLPTLKVQNRQLQREVISLQLELRNAVNSLAAAQAIGSVEIQNVISDTVDRMQRNAWINFWSTGLIWWNDLRHRVWVMLNRPLRF